MAHLERSAKKMTAFEIYVNGRKVCTAGLRGAGVVVPAITWVAGAGPKKKKLTEHLEFRVGGLVSRTQTHVDWLYRQLEVGDEVRIVVSEKRRVDAPKKRREKKKKPNQSPEPTRSARGSS